jgi:predicted permease
MFTVVEAVLMKTLPYPHSDRLVTVKEIDRRTRSFLPTSIRGLVAFGEQTRSSCQLTAYAVQPVRVRANGMVEQTAATVVTATFFDVLQTGLLAGRAFQQSDADGSVVLSAAYARKLFGAETSAVGQVIAVDGIQSTIVGVTPPDFQFLGKTERLWRLIRTDESASKGKYNIRLFRITARLRDSASISTARVQIEAARDRLAEQSPDLYRNSQISLVPLKEDVVAASRPVLIAVSVLVLFLLLIACVNVAILQVTRNVSRSNEFAIRAAIGAGPGQIMRVMFIESVILSVFGAILGLVLAAIGLNLTLSSTSFRIPRTSEIRIDAPALLFSVALLLIASLVSGVVPSVQLLGPQFRRLSVRSSMSHQTRWTMNVLAVSEIGSASILLLGSVLALQQFLRLASVDIGFPSERLMTVGVRLQKESHPDRAALDSFQSDVYSRLVAIPGVVACGGASHIPLLSGFLNFVSIRGASDAGTSQPEMVGQSAASPGYFHAMGIRLASGREFTAFDRAQSQPVAIVNETMARQYWPNQEALGKGIRLGRALEGNPWHTVVGVVGDIHHFGLAAAPRPTVYVPFLQLPPAYEQLLGRTTAIAVRTNGDPSRVAAQIRKTLYALGPEMAPEIRSMDDIISDSIAPRRFPTVVVTVFAFMALWLSGLGLYVVLSSVASMRMPEMGIRLALGAPRLSIVKLMLRSAFTLVCVGLGIGSAGAFLLLGSWRSIFPDAGKIDLAAIAWAVLFIGITGGIASYWPARRAASTDPAITIRRD